MEYLLIKLEEISGSVAGNMKTGQKKRLNDKNTCNPPEDCKHCAYAPQGSELCKADYVVWILETKKLTKGDEHEARLETES